MTLTREQAQLLDGALTREIQWQKEQIKNNKNDYIENQIRAEKRLNDLNELLEQVLDVVYPNRHEQQKPLFTLNLD